MDLTTLLPTLLGLAWLLPLGSFVLILFWGPRLGRGGRGAGYLATGAIVASLALSLVALGCWLRVHPLSAAGGPPPDAVSGEWYTLARFGALAITVGYYIDALTIAMFSMVTLVAACIHVYSFGYMHEELHEVTDRLARLQNGQPVCRRGRFHRFYQYLLLFCFSMLGLVIAGNLAMVFAFWELVGICSYLLIGFYIERRSACNAANKAFIVNRVGDFGMLIGLMAILAGMGTFNFGDSQTADGTQPGIFSQVRPISNGRVYGKFWPVVPEGMAKAAERAELAARGESAKIVAESPDRATAEAKVWLRMADWSKRGYGYGLLIVAGLGIFCGCVGKSAQFPLHVWLPDAMEGPTPVSALIHAATMVAAGVYLVGRCYPIFTPEVLLVIASVGCITLLMAATIALAATDIKRVLAYSTVSQLGYMMLALGLGGWLSGMFHLFTHACFKALLFLCSGSVIHACGTNEMPEMGGLRKKMPWTAGTMLVGCLAIAGAGVPTLSLGLSGFYSKDRIIAQALSFRLANPVYGFFFWIAVGGACLTAFYMFRLWYLTFTGPPRNEPIFRHAHESPRSMVVPLVILAGLSIVAGWNLLGTPLGLVPLLEQARPRGIEEGASAGWVSPMVVLPAEELAHREASIHEPATWWAFGAALSGFLLATAFYGVRALDPGEVRRQFAPVHRFLLRKWWFDELYDLLLLRPVLGMAQAVAALDRRWIDGLVDGAARAVARIARLDDWIDRLFVDGLVNLTARATYALGLRLRRVQTGNLRQYVLLLAAFTVALFILASFCWNWTAGN
ncbi:MAG: NADH-quinone oxidoreductase subunit L [Thermoguttaceae bacterium]|jgi:NADH-quinone oxidoreductase subunit L